MAKWKVVITDGEFENFDLEREILKKIDADVHTYQFKSEDELIPIVRDCDAVIMQYSNLTRKVIESMQKCKIISKYAIGLDRIDIEAATENDICVGHVRDYCIDEVSTHAVGLILDSTRKITLLNNSVKAGNWDYKISKKIYNLRELTLGLNSFGKIAQLVAEKMRPYGVQIITYDPFLPPEVAEKLNVKLVSFDELCRESDILSTHVADMPETRGMFNKAAFLKMKNTAHLVNTGRGPVINEQDLIWALENDEIAGVALDVTEKEPIDSDNPLLKIKNVIITPHSAYYSEESQIRLQSLTAENVVQRLSGYSPRYFANPILKTKLGLMDLPEDWS